MDEWLIRTADNQIYGPYSRQQISEMIQQAKLKLDDEICSGNNYWIHLHESDELKGQLGIEIPSSLYANRQEATLTQTDTEIGERTDPQNVAAMGTFSSPRATVRPEDSDAVPDLSDLIEELGENTAVMSNRAFRDYRQKKAQDLKSVPVPVAPAAPIPQEREIQMEKSKLVQYLAIILMACAVVLILAMLKLLQQQPG